MRNIIQTSLDEAEKRGLSSIAIPAIGTGNLHFPHGRVASASLDEVFTFSKTNPSSKVKEVHLVVYDKDLSSVQAFQSELQSLKGSKPQPPAPADSRNKKRRQPRRAATKSFNLDNFPDTDEASETATEELDLLKPEITIGNTTVQAETGDITKEVTDALVILSNPELDVAFGGGVGKAILTAGGKSIQTECSSLGIQSPGAIVVTGAGKLRAQKIYHMVPDTHSMASIRDSIVKCLKTADSDGITSISLPAIGTGNIRVSVKESSEEMLAAIAKFAQEQPTPSSLRFIRIVIYQRHMLQEYRNAMEASVSSMPGGAGILSRIAGWFRFGKSGSSSSNTTASKKHIDDKDDGSYVEIFAGSKQDVKKVVDEIQKELADSCINRVIEEDAISKLSKGQKKKIKDLGAAHGTVVKIEEQVGRISLRGDAEDVVDVATTIYEILNQTKEEEHTRGIEELMSQNIQWCYYEDEDVVPVPYDASNNVQIEKAFAANQKSVIILIDGARCEIVFDDEKETCLEDGEERKVVRKEIGKGKVSQN